MRIRRIVFSMIIFIMILSLFGCRGEIDTRPLSKTEFLMDTVIHLRIYDNKDESALEAAIDRLKEIEDRMSSHIETSDVGKINRNAGIRPTEVHDDVYYVIEWAKYFAEISGGAYEPTIGPLVDLWNIMGKGKGERQSIPDQDEIEKNMELVDYNDLQLLDDNRVYLKRQGMKLDLGGIAKGYAADEVKRILNEHGINSAIVDLGGNIYVLGNKAKGEPWRIGVQDPFDTTGKYIGILKVKEKSVVTSGDYERYFTHKGRRYHHIIDAKTGYPSDNELAGVSIVSDKSIDGDALSTALFVLGTEDGTELLNQLDNVQGIFVSKKEEVTIPKSLEDDFILPNGRAKLSINPN
ncbi:MAG: FAD:protein FMN transferase [Tissierellia bacterium]|nr:FAD:protein FMN transferase [Tissierellia bacterium]